MDGVPVSDYPSWLDPAKRRKAQSQDHESALDAFSKVTHEDMRKVLPSLDGDSVTKSDLRRALEYLGFYLDDVNFQKIWEKVTSAKMSRGSVMPAATLRIYLGYRQAARNLQGYMNNSIFLYISQSKICFLDA